MQPVLKNASSRRKQRGKEMQMPLVQCFTRDTTVIVCRSPSNSLTQSNSGVVCSAGKPKSPARNVARRCCILLNSKEPVVCVKVVVISLLSRMTIKLLKRSQTRSLFNAPIANSFLKVIPEMEGRKGKCTECQSVFVIEKLKTEKPKGAPTAKPAPAISKSHVKTKPPTAIPQRYQPLYLWLYPWQYRNRIEAGISINRETHPPGMRLILIKQHGKRPVRPCNRCLYREPVFGW